MTAFAMTVPGGFRIVEAKPVEGWHATVEGTKATWSGGSLAPGAELTFTLGIESPPDPGPVTIEAEQLYAGGAVARWPIALTVVPGGVYERAWIDDTLISPLLFFALVGLVILGLILFLVRRKRRRSLQEK